ncbi:MAG: hypothetical protein [Enterobacteria phage RP5]|nr:MAG: hypothetical protein [Enterobacteria phage RP5]
MIHPPKSRCGRTIDENLRTEPSSSVFLRGMM